MPNLNVGLGLAMLITSQSHAAWPLCSDECSNYLWDNSLGGFYCTGSSCKCDSSKSYPCYSPCDTESVCDNLQTSCTKSGSYMTCTGNTCTPDYDMGECTTGSKTTYHCAPNYYGTGKSCSPCPNGGASPENTTSITGCYLPSGSTFTDSIGTYKCNGAAYYRS